MKICIIYIFCLFSSLVLNGLYHSSATAASSPEHVNIQTLDILDLEQAKHIALANNPSVQAARSRLLQAQERVQQARSAWWPRVDGQLSGSRVDLSPNQYQQNLQMARGFNPTADPDNPSYHLSAGLEALWLIFDGFERRFAVEAARLGVDVFREAWREAQRQLLSALGDVYFQALLAREEMAIATADEQFNQRLRDEARVRQEAGAGSLSDMLNFDIRVNAAKSNLLRATQGYRTARSLLAALMGLPEGYLPQQLELAMLSPDLSKPFELPEADALLAYARQRRPDLQQMHYTVQQAQAGIGVAQARFYPSLHLMGQLEGQREGDARFEGDDFGNVLALKLSWNFLDGGQARARLREARLQVAETRESYRHLENMLAAEVQEARTGLELAGMQFELQRDNMARVQQTRDLVENEYLAGQSSLVRLNEAQRDLITAQSRLALALVSLYQSRHHLESVTGALLENNTTLKVKE